LDFLDVLFAGLFDDVYNLSEKVGVFDFVEFFFFAAMASDNQPIVSVKNLTKRFGYFAAVDDISFSVHEKEMFALLGPNGAGKTTTIKMLITLMAPTLGTGTICGFDFAKHPADVRRVIGYVPQSISVDGTLTAYENLKLMAQLYDIPRVDRDKRINDIMTFLKLEDYGKVLVRKFSGGMIRKLEIGQAMIHHPHVLFLDEPTSGLDPIARQNVWQHLRELRDQFGTTIIFTTHQMDEAEDMCNRVAIMNNGKIAAIGTVEELKLKTKLHNASLDDVFIFFTGSQLQRTGSFREIRRTRQTEKRLG
jgi:ABC-2 type transport system ATP-binding protein